MRNKDGVRVGLSFVFSLLLAAGTLQAARTVSVTAVKDGNVTLSFGDGDGVSYRLVRGYGAANGGTDPAAWDTFETVSDCVLTDETKSYTCPLPEGWGETVTYLRFFLVEDLALPQGATRIEYLQSTGEQYIDTGVRGKIGIAAEFDHSWDSINDKSLLGCRGGNSSENKRFFVVHAANNDFGFGLETFYYWSRGKDLQSGVRSVTHFRIADGEQTCTVDGVRRGETYEYTSTLDTGLNMYLFAANMYGNPGLYSSAKLYIGKIWQNGELCRNFIPCLDPSGTACMYDGVTKAFFYNGSSKPFVTGPVQASGFRIASGSACLASGGPDAWLDYVESTGTQYFDTGVRAATGLKARIDLAWMGSGDGGDDWSMLDARTGSKRFFLCHFNYNRPFTAYGTESRGGPKGCFVCERGRRCEMVTDFSDVSALEFYQDGKKTFGDREPYNKDDDGEYKYPEYETHGAIDLETDLYLFACNFDGAAAWNACARLYECRIFRKNADGGFDLIRHYLPCKKGGAAALYEKTTGLVWIPSGDALVAGTELPRPAELVEWVESDGSSGGSTRQLYVDTRVYAKSGLRSDIDFILKDNPEHATDRGILTSRIPESSTRFYLAYHYQGCFCYGYQVLFCTNSQNAVEVPAVKGQRYRIVSNLSAGYQSVTVNGTELHKEGVAYRDDYFSTTNTLALFCYSDSAGKRLNSAIRLFSLKIWDGDEILRDYLPCVADNGKAGLYDAVTERVYFPTALKADAVSEFELDGETGTVTNRLIAAESPVEPVARLEYVESDGEDDYVDLGITGADGVKMVVEMEWLSTTQDAVFVSARKDAGSTRFSLYNQYQYGHFCGYANENLEIWTNGVPGVVAVETGVRFRVTTQLESGFQEMTLEKKVDGGWTVAAYRKGNVAGPMDTGFPLYLFARNMAGTADRFSKTRVYYLKLWQKDANGTYRLVRDLRPARFSASQTAFWDNVSGQPFMNLGSYRLRPSGGEEDWHKPFLMMIFR